MESLSNAVKQFFVRMKTPDTFGYKGWLVSDKFYKRFIAFMGYTFISVIGIEVIRMVILYTAFLMKQI